MSYPGKNNTKFTIKLDADWFGEKDVIEQFAGAKLRIVKVYKFTWWRKILFYLGFPFKSAKCVKVEQISTEEVKAVEESIEKPKKMPHDLYTDEELIECMDKDFYYNENQRKYAIESFRFGNDIKLSKSLPRKSIGSK